MNKIKSRLEWRAELTVILALSLAGCAGLADLESRAESVRQDKNEHYFYQHWVNSFEEQTQDGIIVFRRAGSLVFPASRFRMEYVFNQDGSCHYKVPGPNDVYKMEPCVFTKVKNTVYLYDDQGHYISDLSFMLSAPLGKDVMRLTQGVQKPEPLKKDNKSENK